MPSLSSAMAQNYTAFNPTVGSPVVAKIDITNTALVSTASFTCDWSVMIAAGGVATRDGAVAGTVTNVVLDITRSVTSSMLRQGRAGTTFRLSLAYTGTPSTDPVVAVFGRTGTGRWQLLKNKAGAATATLNTAVLTDVTDGTLFYTYCDPTNHAWDCDGCDEIVVAVAVAFAGTVTNTAIVQGKII